MRRSANALAKRWAWMLLDHTCMSMTIECGAQTKVGQLGTDRAESALARFGCLMHLGLWKYILKQS